MRRRNQIATLGLLILSGAAAGWAQQQSGPIVPPSAPVIKRIPIHPEVPPPKMPPAEIEMMFTTHEAKYKAAFEKFGYLETIEVDELGGEVGGPTGSHEVSLAVSPASNGERVVRILQNSPSSLQDFQLSAQDLEVLAGMPLFPLAGDVMNHYTFEYRGTEKLDELMTYVFLVTPKDIVTGRPYFSGLVWVDNVDLAIVKSYGQFVTGLPRPAHALPFHFFETYRVNTEGKYWFPAYIESKDVLQDGKNELPIRLIIQAKDFRIGQPAPPTSGTAH